LLLAFGIPRADDWRAFAANWVMISSIARVISRYLHPFAAAAVIPM
jgi:hypothetical protein